MFLRNALLLLQVLVIIGPASALGRTPEDRAIDAVLTSFHTAAAAADGELYFSLFADNAVFIGTDISERWSVEQFRAFAEPYFSEGRGWTYTVQDRHIDLATGGLVAWFDEILWNDTYGRCRGTGVLVLTDEGWRIAQYHLTIPIPNELARDVAARIRELEEAPR